MTVNYKNAQQIYNEMVNGMDTTIAVLSQTERETIKKEIEYYYRMHEVSLLTLILWEACGWNVTAAVVKQCLRG